MIKMRIFGMGLLLLMSNSLFGQSVYTWSKLLSDSLIDKTRLQLGSAEQFDRENQIFYSVWASSSSNAKIQKFDLKNNSISTISAGGWPGEMYASIYDPTNKVIVAKRVGRDNTYYLNSSNVWTRNGSGSYDSESYGSTDFFNGVSGSMAFVGGYGWYSTKNWIYEQTGTGWSILNSNQNSCSFPKRVGAKVATSKDNKSLFILSGQGSCDGNQLASSCSLGSAWATDVGVYCWIKDLQKVDLSTNTITKLLAPNHASIDLHGEFAYDYDENVFYTIGGYVPAPVYNRNTGNDSSVYLKVKRFRVGVDTAFVTISIAGTGPSMVKVNNYNGVAFYDSKGKRIVWLRSDGVWAFSTSVPVNQWSGIGNVNNTSNWTSGSIPGPSDSVVIKSGTLTINQNTSLDVMAIHGGATVKLAAPLTVRNLYVKNGTVDLNGHRLTVTGQIIQSTDSSNYYIQAGTAASPKSRSEFLIKPTAAKNSTLHFNPNANRLSRFEIGNGSAAAQITIGNSLKIKGGEDGGSGPGLLTVNKNSKVIIPSGSILTLESDTFNAGLSLAQPAQRSIVCTGTGKFNIERDHYGVRGWRLYSHPFKTDIDLQEVANDIELIGSGGTAEGFYSNTYKNAAAYWYDYSKADSSATTDPAWTAFTSAKGSTISGNSNKWNKNSPMLLFNPGNRRGTDAFGSPSTATYEQGKITLSYTLDSTAVHLNDGTTNYYIINTNSTTINCNNWTKLLNGDYYSLITDNSRNYWANGRTDVKYSSNSGSSWTSANWPLGIIRNSTSLNPGVITQNNRFIAGALDNGMYITTDFGSNWNSTGPTGFGTGAFSMINLKSGKVLSTMGGSQRGIYRLDTTGTTWTKVASNNGDFTDFCLDSNGQVYAACYSSNHANYTGIYKSSNDGSSWTQILSTNYFDNPNQIEILKDTIYYIDNNGNFFTSPISPINFTKRSSVNKAFSQDFVIHQNGFMAITQSEDWNGSYSNSGFYYSLDFGRNWIKCTINGASKYYGLTIIKDTIFMGTDVGIHKITLQIKSSGSSLSTKSKYFFITNPFTTPVKLCGIQGLNSSNVDPYFYYWKQRRNTVTNNFSPAEWQSEKIVVGNNTRDSNIAIPAFGTILVRLKNSSSTTFTIPESAKQLTNFGYIIGGAKGVSKTGLMFADATGSDIGSNGIEIKLLVNDSQEADRVLIYNEANQSPAYTNYDAAKYLNQDFPNVYTLSADNKPLSIDMQDIKAQLDAGQPEVVIPLGVNREANKRFATLKWELSENTTGLEIYLKDLQTETTEPWSTGVVKNIALDQQSLTTKRYALVFKQQATSTKDPLADANDQNRSRKLELIAYPNPTDGKLTLKLSNGAYYQGEIELFDMVGRSLLKVRCASQLPIDVSGLAQGQYVVKSSTSSVLFRKH